jgi:hypothetical protein
MENAARVQEDPISQDQYIEETILRLERRYPIGIPGNKLNEATGGRLSPNYAANLRSKGDGPVYFKGRGGKVLYPPRPLVLWLFGRN